MVWERLEPTWLVKESEVPVPLRVEVPLVPVREVPVVPWGRAFIRPRLVFITSLWGPMRACIREMSEFRRLLSAASSALYMDPWVP
jgi:hypothetical protein